MSMNILVPSLERSGYFRDQSPVTCSLAHQTSAYHHIQPHLPSRTGEGPSLQPWKNIFVSSTFLISTYVLLLELRHSMCHYWSNAQLGGGQDPIRHQPEVLVVQEASPLRQGPLPSTTRSCHLEEQETGARNQYSHSSHEISKLRHALVTYGGVFSMVNKKHIAVHVCLLITFI